MGSVWSPRKHASGRSAHESFLASSDLECSFQDVPGPLICPGNERNRLSHYSVHREFWFCPSASSSRPSSHPLPSLLHNTLTYRFLSQRPLEPTASLEPTSKSHSQENLPEPVRALFLFYSTDQQTQPPSFFFFRTTQRRISSSPRELPGLSWTNPLFI